MTSALRRIRVSGWVLAPATALVAIVIPALAYALIDRLIPGSLPLMQYVVAAAYALTATMTLLEARAALGEHDEPLLPDVDDPAALAELPTVTAIVSAYLPNEQELVADTIVHLATELRVAPGSLQIILAYNTPEDMPDVERVLCSLAELNVAFLPIRVASSHSKAENVNAALRFVRGEVTVLLDADHRPARDAAVRALRWFGSGYDIVQGRCVIRDYDESWLARIVAVEFEQIYAVAHAGRSLAFDTAVFCGTNGWWRTSVLRRIGMDEQMLTEDIDSSVRALLAGYRTVHDRSIISTELAPPTAKAWWGQRMRWAQGWFQVTLKHQAALIRSPRLSGELKLYWTYLLGWRELFPVLSLQIFALLFANTLLGRHYTWFNDPFLIITTLLTVIAGPLAALMTYRVALPSQRRALRHWFFIYAAGSLFYTTAKNTVAMVATVRELIGQRGWIVTRRSARSTRKTLATTAATALAALAVFATAPGFGAQAQAAERATLRLAPTATAMTLNGRAPSSTMSVALPHDWSSVRGILHLHWQDSQRVTPNSTLSVSIDGALVAAAPLSAGRGAIDVPIPRHAPPGHQLLIALNAQLHTRVDTQCCMPDPATGAILVLDPVRTRVSLTGYRANASPLLSDLPGSLVDVVGTHATPLIIALPTTPSDSDVRAAALIAGAVARATGAPTVPVRVVLGQTLPQFVGLPGQIVRIQPTGATRATVTRRPNGRLLLTLGGTGDGPLRAAWAIARYRPHFLVGSAARITSGFDQLVGPAPTTAAITPVIGEGTGDLTYQAAFRLPESQQLLGGKAHLELDTAFNAPAGGRVEISLNGVPLLNRNLPRQGLGQAHLSVDLVQDEADATEQRLALGRLAAGDDFLTIHSNLPAGQPVGGSGDAQVPEFRILGSSLVRYESSPRRGAGTLDLWPWPFNGTDGMAQTTVVLPAAPGAAALSWAISTIAEASRWTMTPLAPQFAIGPSSLPAGDVVVLAGDDLTTPAPLPAGAPAKPRLGVLETYASGGRHVLVAYGMRALRPLASDYAVSKVRGLAAIVARSGKITTLVRAPAASSFQKRPMAWQVPAGILVLGLLVLLAIRMRKVRKRLERLPPPRPGDPLDDDEIRAQLEDWERLVAQEGNGTKPRDDATTHP
ncbi:MAG TPA: cellulose biosynthesis cyclic di-GMP-binding regulatory protein BcsB [Solirubrobacteraceae bacterium]|jgi:cellulose synthase/poly-beta-1,6-N-acetylglucosamine synthase-like glycosyltransferase|nr:cellulose biosynthesis cyclic di-GMP-binding regulatory protein BcsB [Solirubrobacteraceae bacterium]